MNSYFNGVCRNCEEDCDGEFCSDSCWEEWASGLEDYKREMYDDEDLNWV